MWLAYNVQITLTIAVDGRFWLFLRDDHIFTIFIPSCGLSSGLEHGWCESRELPYTVSVTDCLCYCAAKWQPALHILLWISAIFWFEGELWATTEQHQSQYSTGRRLWQWIQYHQCQKELHSFCTVCYNYGLWLGNGVQRTEKLCLQVIICVYKV